MELKEYYKIWKNNISIVIYTILIFVIVVYAWSVRESQTFSASLLLEISRDQFQPTSDYRYDQFYRLQADEKFSQNLEQWLKSPGVSKNIFQKGGINTEAKTVGQLSKSFQAEKIASNTVRVGFATQNEEEAKKIADAIESVVSEKTNDFNREARDPNWFVVQSSDLVIARNVQDLRINFALAALAGFFIGTLLAFGRHYIFEDEN